ncbi:MAG: sensor domain-containing diguanylate cyclase [Marinobacterium sp.]|nr:sensor domain-containing diguanylate cyclase [Marinobacterium sp.]
MIDIEVTALTELCPDPIIGVDRKGIISIFNSAAEQLLQYPRNEVLGRMSIVQVYGGIERARKIKGLLDHPDMYGGKGRLEGYETELYARDGCRIPIRLSATLMEPENDAPQGSIGFFHDQTARKKLEARLKELSVTDDLTGLHNQRHFYETVESELERARRYGRALSLICIDLDHFKQVNDQLGHLEGDRVLRFIGKVIRRELRKTDQAFRYGGDEFMVLLPETEVVAAEILADRLRLRFREYSPYNRGTPPTTAYELSLSLGVTVTDGFETVEELINRADKAMYKAKQSGGNRYMVMPKV